MIVSSCINLLNIRVIYNKFNAFIDTFFQLQVSTIIPLGGKL